MTERGERIEPRSQRRSIATYEIPPLAIHSTLFPQFESLAGDKLDFLLIEYNAVERYTTAEWVAPGALAPRRRMLRGTCRRCGAILDFDIWADMRVWGHNGSRLIIESGETTMHTQVAQENCTVGTQEDRTVLSCGG